MFTQARSMDLRNWAGGGCREHSITESRERISEVELICGVEELFRNISEPLGALRYFLATLCN